MDLQRVCRLARAYRGGELQNLEGFNGNMGLCIHVIGSMGDGL